MTLEDMITITGGNPVAVGGLVSAVLGAGAALAFLLAVAAVRRLLGYRRSVDPIAAAVVTALDGADKTWATGPVEALNYYRLLAGNGVRVILGYANTPIDLLGLALTVVMVDDKNLLPHLTRRGRRQVRKAFDRAMKRIATETRAAELASIHAALVVRGLVKPTDTI